ncbi:rnf217 [Symbiodinium natans]|uniref:Rnf217 protein n=1 Tax=Symbiodinium natans TaxID=878477 RepID=A0A812IH65_9DINO|nr:rnf217 [Symbiodinium natans]
MGDEPTAPHDGVAALVGSEAAFAVINEAWFHVLAGDGEAADLAAAPGCGTPALLDLLTGVELSTGVLGAYTPTLLQGHADLLNDACGGCTSILLHKEEWDRLMWGVRELWGPSQVLRKAVVAVGRDNRSLLAQVASEPWEPTRRAALVMLLQAAAHLDHSREGPLALLTRLLPDGESVVAQPALQQLMSMVPTMSSSRTNWRRRPPPDVFSGELCPPCVDSIGHAREPAPEDMILPKAIPAEAFSRGCLVTQQDEAAVLAGLPPPPMRKIGSNISQGLLVQHRSEEDPAAFEATQCCICMDSFNACQLWHCGREVCGEKAFCADCLRQHAEAVIDSGLYAAPAVRCPVCNLRLATSAWAPLVKEETFAKYHENARALLTYRCAACDETGSYLRPGMEGHAGAVKPFGMLGTEARERLWTAWEAFFLAEVPAEKFLQTVLDEFSCGHRKGGAPPSSMSKVLGPSGQANWIEDLERRLALQLAWMNRFPRQRTPCCGEQFCFRCKVSSWHRGVTCNERLRSEKARQAQLCPGCGVPTQRSEGCRKITCVCGRVWEWEGIEGDSSDEEGAFSEDSGAEDEMQAQTAVNLVAMNNKVSEETVRTLIQALVNAGADVNDWPSEKSPLLLAVQCRNTAAVAALCEVGARVTPEVLEELKSVSLEFQRCEMERLMRPQVQGDPNMRLPLWVWIQAGSAAAVEALLRNAAHEEAVGEDVFIALQRSSGDEDSRKQIAEHLREHVGEEQFQKMQTFSATRRMLMEVRQALDEERDIEVSIIQEALQSGADPNAREKEESAEDEALGLTGLALMAMCYRSSSESVAKGIGALLEARADLETEVDDGATPLLVALRHRNMTALEALAKASAEGSAPPAPRIATEILDEVSCLSEDSRRLHVEELLRPVLRGCGRGLAPLPLWTWVEHGSVAAVEALLRSGDDAVSVEDVISLQRCRVSESQPHIQELLQRKCGEEEFSRLQTEAATRRLLQELREAFDDQRDVDLAIVQNSLELHADPNAQEEEAEDGPEFQEGSYSLSALQLLVTNLHVAADTMQSAVAALVEAKAQVNADIGSDTPLLSALQSRCVPGVAALCQNGAKVSSDCLDELKTISSSKVRNALEDVLQPLIGKDKRLRCPLWMWVQLGAVSAAEALVRNASHDEEIDIDVLVALQRCRGGHSEKAEMTSLLQEHLGEEEFKRLEAAGATRRLLMELREAHTEEREPELDTILEALAQGANPNAQEEDDEETDEEEGEAGCQAFPPAHPSFEC